jgi:TonB family protein
VEAFAAIRLSTRGGKTMSMSYQLELGKGGRDPAPQTGATGDPSLTPKKTGPLAAEAISRVMNAHKARISVCYERVARKKRDLAGTVVLRFTIRGDGSVRNVQIKETTLGNKVVEDCIVELGKQLVFPGEAGRDVTKVWYPFAFSQ